MRFVGLVASLCAALQMMAADSRDSKAAVIAYVFPQNRVLAAHEIAAEKVTRVNYAFANLRGGEIIEGFSHDAENFAVLRALKQQNPALQILVSVGGWTWSGGFSDMALTAASRRKFVESAVRFLDKYKLDGIDIDWEYPGAAGVGQSVPAGRQRPLHRVDARLAVRIRRGRTPLASPAHHLSGGRRFS